LDVVIWISLGGIVGWLAHAAYRQGRGRRAKRGSSPAAVQDVRGIENLEALIQRLGNFEQHILARVRHRRPVARDANLAFDEQRTLGERVADRLAVFGGSWPFLGIFAAVLIGWMLYNGGRASGFDPYPFILLNLVLSCLAAVQAPIILMSQNRQAAKDRLAAQLDYEVNLKAELEVLALHEKLDTLRQKAWAELVAIQERQLALLGQLEERTRGGVRAG